MMKSKKLSKFSELWDNYETSIFYFSEIEEKSLVNEELKESDPRLPDSLETK